MKQSQRDFYLSEIKKVSFELRAEKSNQIALKLSDLLKNQSGTWAAYEPYASEPKIEWPKVNNKINWCYPQISDRDLVFINESKKNISIKDINGFVVPALAYDQKGVRLGRGKGFYDRTLVDHHGKKIGVCFDVSLAKELPAEDHDVRFQVVITESNVIYIEGKSSWN